jgi:hypothetical protein
MKESKFSWENSTPHTISHTFSHSHDDVETEKEEELLPKKKDNPNSLSRFQSVENNFYKFLFSLGFCDFKILLKRCI